MKECLQVFHLTTFDAPKYALKDAYLAMFDIFDAPKYALKDTYLAMFGIFGRAKYGQVRCPRKDLAKCSSDALV